MEQGDQSTGGLPRYLRHYTRTALVLALVYLVTCSLYIIASDRWVASITDATEIQLRIQTYKGITFVALTSLLIFGLSRRMLRRIARDQQRLHNQQQALVEAERRATAGLIAHAVAHDMNNVLTVGMANVELLRSHGAIDADGNAMLNDIAQSFERLHDLSRRMAHTGRSDESPRAQSGNLMELVRTECRQMRRHRAAEQCTITESGPERVELSLMPSLIHDLLQNLLLNAVEAAPIGGRVEVRVSDSPREAVIEVHDNGPGVPADRRVHIFDALYTTKPNGMGLGLLSVKAAVKAHGGRIEVLDSPLGGACFRVVLPKSAA